MVVKLPKILLIEDEKHISFMLQYNLQAEGYETVAAMTGKSALELYDQEKPFDGIILDVNLPEVNGFEILSYIRSQDTRTGILMLTARAADADRLAGIKGGADDYLTKPFNLSELIARIGRMIERSKLFRVESEEAKIQSFERWVFNYDELTLQSKDGDQHTLTALEADLFRELLKHKNTVLSRESLLKKVWGMKGEIESRTVDNFIMRLRKMIEKNPSNPEYLVSVRGRGYMLKDSLENP